MTDQMSTNAPAHSPEKAHTETEINPKVASDIAHWTREFGISGQELHELIRVHGTKVSTLRAAVAEHKAHKL